MKVILFLNITVFWILMMTFFFQVSSVSENPVILFKIYIHIVSWQLWPMICWSIARGVYLLQEEESNQMLYQQLYLCGLLVWDQFSKFWHTSQPLPEWPSRCFFYSTCIFKHLTQVFHYSKSFDTPANLFLGDPVGIFHNLTSVFLVSNPSVLKF